MNQNAKNANVNMDSSLFINCNFDTDYLEVTKTESLRKYEENIYLLGSIFSNKKEADLLVEKEESIDEDNEESLDEEIISLFNENQNNKNFENDIEKINNIILNTSFETKEEKALLDELMGSLGDYKETLNFLKATKDKHLNEIKEFQDLNQKLRASKNIDGEIDEIIHKGDIVGILPNTFKQQESFLRKKREIQNDKGNIDNKNVDIINKINTDLPFNSSDNFVVMNL